MKISRPLALLFLLRFSLFAQTVPPLVNYQGRLSNPDGSPLATTNYQISFSIYDAASSGNLIWGPEIFDGASGAGHGAMIPVVQGYFNVLLGPSDINGDPLTGAFNATNRFVEITVGTNPPIAPRQQILTTPFAFVAGTAGLAGNVVSGINITNATISGNGAGLTNLNALQLSPGAALLGASQNFTGQNNFSPNVGIGTTNPNAPLHVFSAGFPTELVDGSSAAGTWLDLRNTASGTNWQIISTGSGNGEGPGKLLFSSGPSPGTVNGDSLVLEPNGNVGIGTASPSYKLDVNGDFRATGGTIALNTTPDNSSGNIGVGQSAYGNVKFTVESSQSFGIYVDDTASGGTAGYFHGNVGITGSISKGSGTFKIDHPLDPEHQWLYHSFVESPDMMNVYNGNIVTDANGDATVALPSYFEALNKDFRYQLTVLGQFAQAMISSEISSNAAGINFGIKTDKPNVKVSWQVTGVRQDAFANAHRVIPEVPKAGDEIGKYIHPLEHGQPESMQMNLLKPQDKK